MADDARNDKPAGEQPENLEAQTGGVVANPKELWMDGYPDAVKPVNCTCDYFEGQHHLECGVVANPKDDQGSFLFDPVKYNYPD